MTPLPRSSTRIAATCLWLTAAACHSGQSALPVGDTGSNDGASPGITDPGEGSETLNVTWVATVAIWEDDQDDASIIMAVSVTETGSGAGVGDATVMVGPPGAQVQAPWQGDVDGTYSVTIDDYTGEYQLDVTRGDDHLSGAVIRGPTLHSVSVLRDEWIIAWSPSGEPATTATVFTWCDTSRDSFRASEDEGRADISDYSDCELFQVVRRVYGPLLGEDSNAELALKVQIAN